jgi:hypothetical protein
VQAQPGFRDHPAGFEIDSYTVDEDHWPRDSPLILLIGRSSGWARQFMTWRQSRRDPPRPGSVPG